MLAAKLYSIPFKIHYYSLIKNLSSNKEHTWGSLGISTRPQEATIKSNPSFTDGVATNDLHIGAFSSPSVRIFLPESALLDPSSQSKEAYKGYSPPLDPVKQGRKLPVAVQFHGGGFVSGSHVSPDNDVFCRRVAKQWDAIVVAVGYRLAPETKYPGAFQDGRTVLNWLARQFNLAACKVQSPRAHIFDSFGASTADPWLAAHGDPSRCVLLGSSSGANIANHLAREYTDFEKRIEPVKIVAQVLLYPFFIGNSPTRSEVSRANAYVWDKTMSIEAWKLFLGRDEFDLDHQEANPLSRQCSHRLPATLIVTAENDFMRDRAIAYAEALRKNSKTDCHVTEYKGAVHDFATLGPLIRTRLALACSEDISIWVKKYISLRGNEFSY